MKISFDKVRKQLSEASNELQAALNEVILDNSDLDYADKMSIKDSFNKVAMIISLLNCLEDKNNAGDINDLYSIRMAKLPNIEEERECQ